MAGGLIAALGAFMIQVTAIAKGVELGRRASPESAAPGPQQSDFHLPAAKVAPMMGKEQHVVSRVEQILTNHFDNVEYASDGFTLRKGSARGFIEVYSRPPRTVTANRPRLCGSPCHCCSKSPKPQSCIDTSHSALAIIGTERWHWCPITSTAHASSSITRCSGTFSTMTSLVMRWAGCWRTQTISTTSSSESSAG